MKSAWNDLKSFVTVTLTLTLVAIVIISLFTDKRLDENLLLLFTNVTTSVFTYYFAKKSKSENVEQTIENTEKSEQ